MLSNIVFFKKENKEETSWVSKHTLSRGNSMCPHATLLSHNNTFSSPSVPLFSSPLLFFSSTTKPFQEFPLFSSLFFFLKIFQSPFPFQASPGEIFLKILLSYPLIERSNQERLFIYIFSQESESS